MEETDRLTSLDGLMVLFLVNGSLEPDLLVLVTYHSQSMTQYLALQSMGWGLPISSTSSTLVMTPLILPSGTLMIVLVGRLHPSASVVGGLGAGLVILPSTSLDEAVFRSRLPSRDDIVFIIASSFVAEVEMVESRSLLDVVVETGRERVVFSEVEVLG